MKSYPAVLAGIALCFGTGSAFAKLERTVRLTPDGVRPSGIIWEDPSQGQVNVPFDGKTYSINVPAGGKQTFLIVYRETGSLKLPKVDFVRIDLRITPGPKPLSVTIPRLYPQSCNIAALKSLKGLQSTPSALLAAVMQARLMLRFLPNSDCQDIKKEVMNLVTDRLAKLYESAKYIARIHLR